MYPNKDFSKSVIKSLTAKGFRLLSSTLVPGADGTFANGDLAYNIDASGMHIVRTYLEVVALSK